jgi:sugar-specific transcriptional regulator TrmB
MKTIYKYLLQLDFSETEAKLYLILLKTGSMTVADLAQKADINRSAAYSHIHALLKKGVISQGKGATSKVTANPPAQLEYLVEQKISTTKRLKEELFPIVTMLNTTFMQMKAANESEIRYYKSRNSVKAIYTDVLKADKIRAYFNPDDLEKTFPENIALFNEALDRNPKLMVYEVAEDSPYARKAFKQDKRTPRHPWKFLPKDIKLTANDILMYDGKVAIINIGDKQNVTGVVLENRDYYNNSVQLFDLLWRLLPAPTFER